MPLDEIGDVGEVLEALFFHQTYLLRIKGVFIHCEGCICYEIYLM